MLGAIAVLLGLGLVIMYSSSSVFALRTHGDSEYFLKLQVVFCLVGVVALYGATRSSSEWLRRHAGMGFLVACLLCLVVLIPGIGHLAGGARRWLTLGPVGFQPSELAKVAIVAAMAAVLAKREERLPAERSSLLVPILIAQVPVALILAEPDLGNALVIEVVVALMVFSAGLRLRALILVGLAALPVFYHLLVGTPFRLQRLLSYIDPWAYRSSAGYQVTEALISIGSGGIQGVGLGESKHKLFFLPAAHTDFIFAIVGEELGLLGVLIFLLCVGVLAWRGFRAARNGRTRLDSYLAVGITSLFVIPSLFNMGVATGLLPTKGLPLPLVSYGGSNLVATLYCLGLLLRVDREARPKLWTSEGVS